MADDPKPVPEAQPAAQQPQFPTDYSQLSTVYTNFCRVSVTPEELVLDFGLNTQMAPNPSETIKLSHRLGLRASEPAHGRRVPAGPLGLRQPRIFRIEVALGNGL